MAISKRKAYDRYHSTYDAYRRTQIMKLADLGIPMEPLRHPLWRRLSIFFGKHARNSYETSPIELGSWLNSRLEIGVCLGRASGLVAVETFSPKGELLLDLMLGDRVATWHYLLTLGKDKGKARYTPAAYPTKEIEEANYQSRVHGITNEAKGTPWHEAFNSGKQSQVRIFKMTSAPPLIKRRVLAAKRTGYQKSNLSSERAELNYRPDLIVWGEGNLVPLPDAATDEIRSPVQSLYELPEAPRWVRDSLASIHAIENEQKEGLSVTTELMEFIGSNFAKAARAHIDGETALKAYNLFAAENLLPSASIKQMLLAFRLAGHRVITRSDGSSRVQQIAPRTHSYFAGALWRLVTSDAL